VIVALVFGSSNFESPTTTAILTIVAYVLIQQLEGNFLTPASRARPSTSTRSSSSSP
jgi:predicted PurR-regulated permease PerM